MDEKDEALFIVDKITQQMETGHTPSVNRGGGIKQLLPHSHDWVFPFGVPRRTSYQMCFHCS